MLQANVITSAAQTFLNGSIDYDNIYDLVYVRPSVRPSQILTGRKTILHQPRFYKYEIQASASLDCIHTELVGSYCTKKSTLALDRSIIPSENNFVLLITTCDVNVWNRI